MAENEKSAGGTGKRRLVLCFDGTWNTAEDETNVSRIYAAIADKHSGCDDQLKFYDEGVGTTWGSRILGGMFGTGLDRNVLEGYCWLINNYSPAPGGAEPIIEGVVDERGNAIRGDDGQPKKERFENGDEIFLFGFSRGAYTARSLAGLVNACGLIKKARVDRPVKIDSPLVSRAWALYRERTEGGDPGVAGGDSRYKPKLVAFREDHAHNVKVHFVAVWDTVGALGLPVFGGALRTKRYAFHDTSLCRVVEYAYHAIAIDEHRRDYDVALWTRCDPVGTKEVKQRWFAGAHTNVGGGYEDDLLPELPLRWIAERACARGLKFVLPTDQETAEKIQNAIAAAGSDEERCARALWDFQVDGTELMAPVHDSYAGFGFGLYQLVSSSRVMIEPATRRLTSVWNRFGFGRKKEEQTKVEGESDIDGRYYRRILVNGVNESIDDSAEEKWAKDPRYRPRNLAHAGREADVAAAHPCPGDQPSAAGGR
jgi:uncharacterized protein (DUF2235 family)